MICPGPSSPHTAGTRIQGPQPGVLDTTLEGIWYAEVTQEILLAASLGLTCLLPTLQHW